MLATVSPFRVVIDGNERMDWYGWLDRYPGGRKSITVKGYSRPEDAMRACEADMLGGLDDERRREAVRQQWLRTAMSAHERMQLRAAWQREDAAGKAA